MKQLITKFLATLIIAMIGGTVLADDDALTVKGDIYDNGVKQSDAITYTYTVSDGEVSITKASIGAYLYKKYNGKPSTGDGEKGEIHGEIEITIPNTINGQTVTTLGSVNATSFKGGIFYDGGTEDEYFNPDLIKYHIGKVNLPSGLKTLAPYCFTSLSYIQSIEIPASVESLGNRCFINCTRLKKVTFEDADDSDKSKLTEIGQYCFAGDSLTSIILPVNLETIKPRAFATSISSNYSLLTTAILLGSKLTDASLSNKNGSNIVFNKKTNIYSTYTYTGTYGSNVTKMLGYRAAGNVYGTVCFNKAVSLSSVGIGKLYEETDGSHGLNGTITLKEVTSPAPGTPYIFKRSSEDTSDNLVVFLPDETNTEEVTEVTNGTYLKGTFEALSDATNAYVLDEDGAFVKSGSVDANTAYLDFSSGDVAILAEDFGGFESSLAVTSGTDDSGNATLSVSIPAIAGLPSYTTSADEATHSLMPAMATDASGNTTYTFNITDGTYTSFSTQAASKTVNLKYTRTFQPVGWYSWYSPFEFTAPNPENSTVKFAIPSAFVNEGESDSKWALYVIVMTPDHEKYNTVKANFPYVIKPTSAGTATIAISGASLQATPTAATSTTVSNNTYIVTLTGNYDKSNQFPLNSYSLTTEGTGFLKITQGGYSIPVFRFYLEMDDNPNDPYANGRSGVKPGSLSIVEFADEATAIAAINKAVSKDNGAVYDLQGRRVTKPVRGIYIQNGRKVLVK